VQKLRRCPWILLVLVLAGLHMAVFNRGLGGDGWAPFAALESLADDGDLALENNVRGPLNGLVPTPAGHLAMQYPPGILILDALPFAAGRALDALLPPALIAGGAELPPAGRVPRGVFLSAACIVLARNLAVLVGLAALAAALLRLGYSERVTAASLALTFFGGPLLFYSLVGMTHAPVFALAALLLLALVRARETPTPRRYFLAGLVAGAATLVRLGSVALLLPAMLAAATGPPAPSPVAPTVLGGVANLRRLLVLGAGFALPLLLLPFWLWLNFGTATPGYGGEWKLTLASPWNVLLSPRHGLFLFHPALVLAALGLGLLVVRELRERRALKAQALSGEAIRGMGGLGGFGSIGTLWFLAVATLYGWWGEWANEGGYGQRFLIDALPAGALGFAAFLEGRHFRRARIGLALGATLFGFVLFFAAVGGLVSPPAGLPWPLRLSDYASLVRDPLGPHELGVALRRSSFLVRGLLGPVPSDAKSE
jgi:hypothetical protein